MSREEARQPAAGERVAAELPAAEGILDRATEAEVYYLKAKAVFYLDDLEGALFLVRRALKTGGEVAIYLAFEGQILFELGRFLEAKRVLDTAVAMDPEAAHAVYHLGLVLERLGPAEEATRAFSKANALDPERYPLPIEIDLCVTRDGQVVVWHDWDPDGLVAIARQAGAELDVLCRPVVPPEGHPMRRPVCDLTLDELRTHYGYAVIGTDQIVPTRLPVLEEVVRSRKVGPHLGERLGPDRVAVPLAERGRLKQALLALGWPADDQAGYVEGAPLPIELLAAHAGTGERFELRRYQRESVAAFAAAGSSWSMTSRRPATAPPGSPPARILASTQRSGVIP